MQPFVHKYGFKLLVTFMLAGMVVSVFFWINRSPALPVIKQAPNFTLNKLDGHKFNMSDSNGKVRLVEFMFTSCPDICPLTTYNMVRLQEDLKKNNQWGDQVQFLSVTFDPLKDTPEVFKQYGDRMRMDYSGWTLLTGTEAETAAVAKSFGVLVQKMPDGQFMHTVTSLFLIDGSGNIRKIFAMGEQMDNQEILQSIRQLTSSTSK
ncbi:SCO family protein [Paenibacillus periandrae]|uniref:SCO family protein n=1 Tax=Paenibacillus periandrae TaxID=1761741 RepID=UPI001F097FA5|nr:SCO family protein [Paenibacillus periandrae]